jgi:cysteine-S-conjugate beta-lyase
MIKAVTRAQPRPRPLVRFPAQSCRAERFYDALDLFGIGASWGGFESLIQPMYPERSRTATKWAAEGPGVRIHIGLEDSQDLIADLAQGFEKMKKAAA